MSTDTPFKNLPPDVLDCLACHILAANWLATQAADYNPLFFSSGDAIDEAMARALNKYRTMPPETLATILDESLQRWDNAQQTIKAPPAAAEDSPEPPEESGLPYPDFPNPDY